MTADQTDEARTSPISLLAHPAVLISILVVALNDHVLKGSGWLPGLVTGKLSDVAGLFFFPVALAVILAVGWSGLARLFSPARRSTTEPGARPAIDVAAVLTVAVFSAVNLFEPANELARHYWGVFTMDPTDLVCLPMVWVAHRFATRRWPPSTATEPARATASAASDIRPRHLLLVAAAALVTLGTPAPPETTPGYPSWQIDERTVHCHDDVEIHAWVAKSGKDGAGLVLLFDNTTDTARTVAVDDAVLALRPRRAPFDDTAATVRTLDVAPVQLHDRQSVYLPFVFDNNEAWNREVRAADLTIDLRVDNESTILRYEVFHRDAPWAIVYEPRGTYPGVSWGPEDGLPGPEVTGPARNVEHQNQWLIRDPDDRDDVRIRFEYESTGGCEGTRDD